MIDENPGFSFHLNIAYFSFFLFFLPLQPRQVRSRPEQELFVTRPLYPEFNQTIGVTEALGQLPENPVDPW